MRGLASTIHVLQAVSSSDVLLLTETWAESPDDTPALEGYERIAVTRPWKHSGAGRASGGLVCYVKRHLSKYITQWKASADASLLWLKFDKALGLSQHLFVCLAYVWPEKSTHYNHPQATQPFDTLSEDIAEIYSLGGEVLLTGDFNARTGTREDFINTELLESIQPGMPKFNEQPANLMPRCSADGIHNKFGLNLLQLCHDTDLLILNGRTRGDECGKFTCHTVAGQSVVDYFIAGAGLSEYNPEMYVRQLQPESDHCPLTLALYLPHSQPTAPPQAPSRPERGPGMVQPPATQPTRFRYTSDKEEAFCHILSQSLHFHFGASPSPSDTTCYATAIQECITSAATRNFGFHKPKHHSRHQHKPWYDDECKALRRELTTMPASDPEHATLAKQYKRVAKAKRRLHDRAAQLELCELAGRDPSQFWRRYKKATRTEASISQEKWKEAFESLFGPETQNSTHDTSAPSPSFPSPTPSNHDSDTLHEELNAPITTDDVQAAFKRLKRHKAAGLDGIKAEYLLDATDLLLQPLTCTFNQMLQHGVPESWCKGVIHPIFKSGDEHDPANYRGITVTAVLAKLFAMVLENRLTTWAEAKHVRAAGQAGFRKDYRTVDNMFIIHTLIEQTKKNGQQLYCCFVDFRKAFDSIPRERMWEVLHELGLQGDVIAALKSMYAQDEACVLTQQGLTKLFKCTIGVKQGCPASPLLFGLYIDELEKLLLTAANQPSYPSHQHAGGGGPGVTPGLNCIDAPKLMEVLVPLLLFADDLALFSLSHSGLQAQLDVLEAFCQSRGLKVNVDKTKVIVFSHRHTACPPLVFEGEEIARVDAFKYLGLYFHETRGLSCGIEQLTASARKALFAMLASCRRLHIHDPRLRCKLFDALVRPVLSYACELWAAVGSATALKQLEQVHRMFLRGLLGLPENTVSKMIYAEFGRTPLKHFWWKQCMNYLKRLHAMDNSRLCKVAFMAACRTNTSWRRGLDQRFAKLGMERPAPGEEFDPSDAIAASETMYIDWMMNSDPDSRKETTYYSFKVHHRFEPYIFEAKNFHLRKILAKFRTGSHWLQVQTGRYHGIAYEQRSCSRCSNLVEDEMHAIFSCPDYDHVRVKFPDLFQRESSLQAFFTRNPVHRIALFLTDCRALRLAQ